MSIETQVPVAEQIEGQETEYTITSDGSVVETAEIKQNPDAFHENIG